MKKRLTHLDSDGTASMVDVGGKSPTRREAVARARVKMSRETLKLVEAVALPKGDVLATARIAGILAAKRTPELIPLTHPLALSHIEIRFEFDRKRSAIDVLSTVRCEGKTGVEIEAMTACSIAALTIYDMTKSAEKGIVIEEIALLEKRGGKGGEWRRE
ncbi:MAG TPA: cyclic pyranopterin monophosphate synthase MoaC [Thermoanaerobaculia bacterium]|nr:cyclic pyranopterin monophosphate synthase MoaC [Thermoanaerobaculia bacterium]